MLKKQPKVSADNVLHNVMTIGMQPKVYAILLTTKEQDYLGISVSFSLEDAIAEVKETAKAKNDMNLMTCTTHLWSILSMEELKKKVFAAEVFTAGVKKDDKIVRSDNELSFINSVMKDIVDKHDVDLYEKIKVNLNTREKAYLEDKLFNK